MVDTGEKLPNVTLEYPGRTGMVAAGLKRKLPKPVNGFMHPFPVPARKRVGDECAVEERIKDAVDGMVEQPITHACFVDVAQLRIGNVETLVGAVVVGMVDQRLMER